jgi:hypothetical protein
MEELLCPFPDGIVRKLVKRDNVEAVGGIQPYMYEHGSEFRVYY